MGAGDDTFVWNPGDDNDTIEGQAGFDTMLFNGANVSENVDISANGGRVLFTRDIANVTMDSNDVESIDFNALGGVDNINVNDLSGTDVTEVNVNLADAGGLRATGRPTRSRRAERAATTSLDRGRQTLPEYPGARPCGAGQRERRRECDDRVSITGLAGDDIIDASGVPAGRRSSTLDGGAGDDVLDRQRTATTRCWVATGTTC